jgi:hypothetical protein
LLARARNTVVPTLGNHHVSVRVVRVTVETGLIARASRTARTRDTRRRILIGGAVPAAVEQEAR